ncbi:hypothetical protein ACFPIJ_63380 [Dactylosporangium cerinum]|uniref:Uncharacterized protein n=1 Tax=Dactylosporangium cerinum TaxID=1434730 RepID=A0ABV9WLN8_9ACTN
MNLYVEQYLDRAHRSAALRVLADVQGLTYAGPMTDLAGRTGVAFTLTEPDHQYTIMLNPQTGQLLALQRLAGVARRLKCRAVVRRGGGRVRDHRPKSCSSWSRLGVEGEGLVFVVGGALKLRGPGQPAGSANAR